MNQLKEFKKYEENKETLITIYFYNIKKEEVIDLINKELNKISVIQNISIKKKLNDRFYNLRVKIDKIGENTIINSLFLLNDEIFEYKFTQENINTIKDYKLRNLYIKKDVIFDIDYIIDLFTNFEFNYCCQVSKNHLKFKKINNNKNKIIIKNKFINKKNMIEIINNFILEHKIIELLISGLNNNIKCINNEKNNKLLVEEGELSHEEINKYFYNRKYDKNNILLEKKLNELSNSNTNLDLFVFGKLKKEILSAIECYQLKELYIEERKLEKLKQFVDDSYFNFNIIPIQVINSGDIADKFIKDYNGLMGIKYY